MENVPELVNEQVFTDFLNVLEARSYNVTYKIINAADYGVPQRRKRLLLLASSEKKIQLIEPTHKKKVTVREIIAGLSHVEAGKPNDADKLHVAASLSKMNLDRIRYSIPGGTWRDWPVELILNCHRKKTGQSYSSVYGSIAAILAPETTTMEKVLTDFRATSTVCYDPNARPQLMGEPAQ